MNPTTTYARYTGRWDTKIHIEPGTVPDRPMPYSAVQATYRPDRLDLVFYTSAHHQDPTALRMENGSGPMMHAAQTVAISTATLHGQRLKKDGTPGQHTVDEKFHVRDIGDSTAPEWIRQIITDHLHALGTT